MDKKKEFKCPAYLPLTISIIAMALGVFSGMAAFVFISISFDFIDFLPIGIIFGIGGILLLILGIFCCINSAAKKQGLAARYSYLVGAGWCLTCAGLDIYLAIIAYPNLAQMFLFIFAAVAFLAALILLLIASIRIGKWKSFRYIGMSGSIVFILCSGANVFSFFSATGGNGITILLQVALIVLAVFLLVMSVQGKYVEEGIKQEMPASIPEPHVEQPHPEGEEERIHLLKEYKELLDSGAITEEEYDKKKKEILGE